MARQLVKGMTMLLLIVAVAFVTAIVSANAQSRSARANIPFEFVVGTKTLHAGSYSVTAMPGDSRVRISSDEESVLRLAINAESSKPAEKGKLVFRRYGNRYFLAEVWNAGEQYGQQLLKSKEEKAIERELASIPSKRELALSGYERIEVALVRQ